MSVLYRGIKNTSYLSLGTIVSQIVHFFAVIYIARLLGPTDYGVYTTVGAFVGIFQLFTFGGLVKVVLREGSKNPEEMHHVLERSIGIRNLSIVLAVVLCIATSFFTSDTLQLHIFITIYSANLVMISISNFISTVYLANENMKYILFFNMLDSILSTGLTIFVLYLGSGVLGLLLVQLGSQLIVLVINYWFSKRFVRFSFFSRPRFDMDIIKPAAVFSLLAFLTTAATRIDVLMIMAMSTPKDVGIYGIAFKLVQKLNVVRNLVTTAFFPIFVKRFNLRPMLRTKMITYSLVFAVSISIFAGLVAFFSEDIIRVLFGQEYMASAKILSLLLFAQAFNWATIPFTTAAQATHNEKFMLYGLITSATLNIPLNYILFNKFGLVGIAYSTLIVYAVGNFAMILGIYFAMRKQGHIIDKEYT